MTTRFLVIILSVLTFSCSKPVETVQVPPCGPAPVINATAYANTSTNNYTIVSAIVNGNCLEVKISSSGCNGASWTTELIDSEAILKSNPPQRLLKLKLTNNELCNA